MNAYPAEMEKLKLYGNDIFISTGMKDGRAFMHHGKISVYRHSVEVAIISILIAKKMRVAVDERSMVRGALLHDYYLYDWHDPTSHKPLHGFHHARTALRNAERDFSLNHIERDIIKKHMFPLNFIPPVYRESIIVCIADKVSATMDYVRKRKEAK